MSPHSDTLSWFRANQSLLFLLNEHTYHYTTDAVIVGYVYVLRWNNYKFESIKEKDISVTGRGPIIAKYQLSPTCTLLANAPKFLDHFL